MMAVALSPAILLAVVALLLLAVILRDPGRPTTPDWRQGEMSALVLPTGEHELVGRLAFEQIADDTGHSAQHSWESIPPDMRYPALLMSAVERARALTYELGNWRWRPARPYRTAVAW